MIERRTRNRVTALLAIAAVVGAGACLRVLSASEQAPRPTPHASAAEKTWLFLSENRRVPAMLRLTFIDLLRGTKPSSTPAFKQLVHDRCMAVATDSVQPEIARAEALSTAVDMLICLHEEGRASETEMRQCAASVADLLTGSRDLPRLAAACARLLGVLQFPQEADALMAALKAPGSAARIEPTASICIALGRLRRSEAVPPLRELMSAAEEESLFDASVYALGQIGTIDALDALNDAGDRFHTGSVGAVIRLDYSQTVERLLRESVEPEALNIALEAAQHLTNPDDCADALLERLQEGSLPPEVRPRTLAFFHDAASGEICRRAVALLPPPSEPNEEWRRLALRADAGALVSWLGQEPARGAKP